MRDSHLGLNPELLMAKSLRLMLENMQKNANPSHRNDGKELRTAAHFLLQGALAASALAAFAAAKGLKTGGGVRRGFLLPPPPPLAAPGPPPASPPPPPPLLAVRALPVMLPSELLLPAEPPLLPEGAALDAVAIAARGTSAGAPSAVASSVTVVIGVLDVVSVNFNRSVRQRHQPERLEV